MRDWRNMMNWASGFPDNNPTACTISFTLLVLEGVNAELRLMLTNLSMDAHSKHLYFGLYSHPAMEVPVPETQPLPPSTSR